MTIDKRSESQWPEIKEEEVPEGWFHLTPETMDEMDPATGKDKK